MTVQPLSYQMPSNVSSQNVVVDAPNLAYNFFPTTLTMRGSSARMMHESERLKTYQNWPLAYLSGEAMSKGGFYYTNCRDIVRCPFCDIEVKNWEEGDDPLEDHKKWNHLCPFITNPDTCGNVPLPPNFSARESWSDPPSPSDSGYDTCGTHDMRGMDLFKRIGNPIESKSSPMIFKNRPPSFPQYASLEERHKSFSNWPVSLKIKPNQLSDAGFYYTGKGDQTICFYCGGGLKDWEDNDDPWMEHAKWFSKCTYVLLHKGEGFVNEAKESIDKTPNGEVGKSSADSEKDKVVPASSGPIKEIKEPVASCSANKQEESLNDAMLCKFCYSKGLEVVFLPCGHLISCIDCSVKLTTCGICRKPIKDILRTFVS